MNAEQKEVIDFIEQYFIDDERASINDCVRDALALRIPVTPAQVSGVRTALRMRQQRMPPALKLVPAPQVVKTLKQHWPSDKPPPHTVVDIPAPPETKEEKKKFASIEERRFFYESVLLDNPSITVVKAMQRVKERFGRSVDPGYAVAALRLARSLHQPKAEVQATPEPKLTPVAQPVAPSVPKEEVVAPPKTTKQEGEYLILYKLAQSNTTWETLMLTKDELPKKMEELVNKGIRAETIKVFKEVKAKVKVVVDFD